jgi:hypothetical protein
MFQLMAPRCDGLLPRRLVVGEQRQARMALANFITRGVRLA